jgi:hypothetical protein
MNEIRREEEREDDRVDREQQQRIGERPEKSEDRAAVTRFQIARRERSDELAVAVESAKRVQGWGEFIARISGIVIRGLVE